MGNREENQEVVGHRWRNTLMGGHRLQRVVDFGRVRTLYWCRRRAGWASGNRLGKRLRDVCKPADPRLAHQLKGLEQGFTLRRRTNDGRNKVEECR